MNDYFEEEEDDFEEEEDEDEDMRFKVTNLYEKDLSQYWPEKLCAPLIWRVTGDLSGDINWNNIDAQIILNIPYSLDKKQEAEDYYKRYNSQANSAQFGVYIRPFTGNCGIKSIQYLNGYSELFIKFMESFLYYCCNCGIIIGSDYEYGGVKKDLIKYSTNYIWTDPVWNPNYTFNLEHKIQLFYKYLDKDALVDYWG